MTGVSRAVLWSSFPLPGLVRNLPAVDTTAGPKTGHWDLNTSKASGVGGGSENNIRGWVAITSTSVSSLELEVSSLELLAWPADTVPEGEHRGLRTLP